MSKNSLKIGGSIAFALVGIWLGYSFYVSPFWRTPVIIAADPHYLMSAALGASIGFLIALPFLWVLKIRRKENCVLKCICIFMSMFALFGMLGNLAIYKKIIEPNAMIECPLKIGYKKNLLRDYVFDTSLCKKR